MKKIMASLTVFLQIVLSAAPVSSIRSGKDRVLPAGTVVEGVIVSDCRSANNALNPNLEWDRVDYAASHRTAYLQSEDGGCGVRIIFSTQYLTAFRRHTLVSIDLSGCSLAAARDPERYTVSGVDPSKVTVKQTDFTVPRKLKTISQLCDADLYTEVTVSGLEYLSKQGSFANVFENCTKATPLNDTRVDTRLGTADGWAQLLQDREGDGIYVQVNSFCQWRRNNIGVPGGVGDVTGILVAEHNPRYGGTFGKWSLRPLFREDIGIPRAPASSFRTVATWTWDRNYKQALSLLSGGLVEWVGAPGVTDDRIVADEGPGFLSSDSGCGMYPAVEYDTRWCTDSRGTGGRNYASLCFDGRTSSWLHPGSRNSSITVETTTKDISGNGLIFNFSFLAGDGKFKSASGIPAEWTVEYSTDGVSYHPTGFSTQLRPLVWSYGQEKGVGVIFPSFSAAMGFCEYGVKLPASLLGREKVCVRLIPCSLVVTKAVSDPAADLNSDKFNGGNDTPVRIFLGMVSIKAY